MPSFETFRRVAFVRTDVSDKGISSITRMERISELGTTLVVTTEEHWCISVGGYS
jgi:hypothetical protein